MDALDLVATIRDWLRRVSLHRRALAATLAGLAVFTGLSAVRPRPIPSTIVWVAARDLPGGQPLRIADVVLRKLPTAVVPFGALLATNRIVGRLLAAPVRRGEPMTDVRLLEPPLLTALGRPGLVAVPVRLVDGAAAAALVRAGDEVDILAATDLDGHDAAPPRTVAADVIVLSVPGRDDPSAGDTGGLIVVATTAQQASVLAEAAVGSRLSIILKHR